MRQAILKKEADKKRKREREQAEYRKHGLLYERTALDVYEDGMQGRLPH